MRAAVGIQLARSRPAVQEVRSQPVARPAGQASDMTFTVEEVDPSFASTLEGILGAGTSAANSVTTDPAARQRAKQLQQSARREGLSDAQFTSLMTNIGGAIGTTADAIVRAVLSGNQVEIARINADTQQYIANIAAQQQRATTAAEQERLRRDAEGAMAVQRMLADMRPAEEQQKTMRYALIVGGLFVTAVAVALILKPQPRKNPRRRRRA